MKRTAVLLAVALAVGLMGIDAPAGARKRNLAMGSTSTSSSHYGYFVGAAKAINLLVPDVNVSVVETGATVDNLKRMQKGQLDMGLVTTEQSYLALAAGAAPASRFDAFGPPWQDGGPEEARRRVET